MYETGGSVGHPACSPHDHVVRAVPVKAAVFLAVVDVGRRKPLRGMVHNSGCGLVYPDGKEIWFTASKSGVDRTLYATTLNGDERMVLRLPGAVMIFDIYKDGRVLLMRASWRRELISITTDDMPSDTISPGRITAIRRSISR